MDEVDQMDIKSLFSDKLDKFVFLKISGEEAYLPVKSTEIIKDIKEKGGLEKIPFSYFLYGMFFILGADEKFSYTDDYMRIIARTEGSTRFIKGKIAEEIKQGNFEDGYVLLKGLSQIEKSEDVFDKLIMVLEELRSRNSVFAEEEIAMLEKAKEIQGYYKPYFYEAVLRRETKDYEGALKAISRYIEMSGTTDREVIGFRDDLSKSADYEKGKELIYDDPKGALKLLIPLTDAFPEDATLLYYIGVCYRVLENHEKSIYYLNQALELDNDLVQVVNELGINYASMGDCETAVSYLRKAFEATKSVEICTNLVMCYLEMGNMEDAKSHLALAEKLDPEDEIVQELKKHLTQY
ncbi:MAG: repeat-containing protein [Firmicutes bacterium]|nr:repeat-containing protein [Bacillota bacterium]